MKRFYCTTCQKVKRVRVLPAISNPLAEDVKKRTGRCRWHSNVATHSEFLRSIQPSGQTTLPKAKPIKAVVPMPRKAKKGGK